MSEKRISKSSTSLPSAKSRTRKTHKMLSKPEASLTEYGQGEIVSAPSNSRLAEVYNTEEFRNEWANDIRFHIARNLLHLRRFRGLSQQKVAKAVGTSQSAVARAESGQENITADTLERFVIALGGRFYVSIPPQEHAPQRRHIWWEPAGLYTMGRPWSVVHADSKRTADADLLLIGLARSAETNPPEKVAGFLMAGTT